MKKVNYFFILLNGLLIILIFSTLPKNTKETVQVSSITNVSLSNTKIGWGVSRKSGHIQPDLGNRNRVLLAKYDGIDMGNSEQKIVYLTFDEGYEAGYTSKILDVLKDNNVKATFFITAHYLNTEPELIKRMIDEGHIVRQPYLFTQKFTRFK